MKWLQIATKSTVLEGRDAPLYHGASFFAALKIINGDAIDAKTPHDISIFRVAKRPEPDQEQLIHGVSLSRSKRVAFDFGYVVFELDQRRLAQTNRLHPLDYWAADDPRSGKPTKRGPHQMYDQYEAEEFCVGPIKPLSRYLTAIYMTTRGQSAMLHQYQRAQIASLLDHPLLKIIPS